MSRYHKKFYNAIERALDNADIDYDDEWYYGDDYYGVNVYLDDWDDVDEAWDILSDVCDDFGARLDDSGTEFYMQLDC